MSVRAVLAIMKEPAWTKQMATIVTAHTAGLELTAMSTWNGNLIRWQRV